MIEGKHALTRTSRFCFKPRIVIAIALVVFVIPPISFLSGFAATMLFLGSVEDSEALEISGELPEVTVVEVDEDGNIVDSWTGRFELLQDSETKEVVFIAEGAEIRIPKRRAVILGNADAVERNG